MRSWELHGALVVMAGGSAMIIPLPSSLRRIMRRIIDSAESSSGRERQMERGLEVLSKRALADFTHSSKIARSIVIVNGSAASFIFSFSFLLPSAFLYPSSHIPLLACSQEFP